MGGATSLRGWGLKAVLARCGTIRDAEGRTRDSGCNLQFLPYQCLCQCVTPLLTTTPPIQRPAQL